jgi:2-C-methyl-D-erythritol 4-phosphate cytidylyltransferase/2-C-methyl-D-erythritol 2,4-cyclodiphosphate synthase
VSVFGIVVAAGTGERFGRPKSSIDIAGRPMWRWASDALDSGGCDQVVVVGDVPGGIAGGVRRRDSVAAGLAVAPAGTTYVLVHDAARPLASADLVRRVIERLRVGDVEAVVPSIAVRDTLKHVSGDTVEQTVDRTGLVVAQTPQGFTLQALVRGHGADDGDATDDALLVERSGGSVVIVPGEDHNLKVTYPGDLAVAEALAKDSAP